MVASRGLFALELKLTPLCPPIEIYQIVSAKALDQNESAPQIGDRGRVLEISKQADPPKTDGKCC